MEASRDTVGLEKASSEKEVVSFFSKKFLELAQSVAVKKSKAETFENRHHFKQCVLELAGNDFYGFSLEDMIVTFK